MKMLIMFASLLISVALTVPTVTSAETLPGTELRV